MGEGRSARVQQAYSSLSGLYIDLFGSGEHEHPDDLRLIEEHLGHLPGPVLDVGCGPGHLTELLRRRGCAVTGIDLVPEFIAHARQAHPSARFELADVNDLRLEEGSLAGVLAWYSLIHTEPAQLDGLLGRIRRMMAPGGALVLGFFEGDACEAFEHKVITAYRWPVQEMADRLGGNGFEVVERLQRPREGERRPHAALAAVAR